MTVDPCPCDTGKPYATCCGRFHDGRPAPTAVALMRSRYAAFARGLADYLLTTWHPATRPAHLEFDDTTWTGLVIEATEAGKAWDVTGAVAFAASWRRADGTEGALRERSRFALIDGRWLYVDGVHE
ncbi:MAG: SEC-C domain-containing protein [Tessaracoccus sp.]|uniref:YchJ family protein n=1 Tax=Tessaracoccus sp. TaxID=1971211 RepID=UPI001ED3007E|nr:YchJ family metal-binding protein [Tessaracoccus sp.]MBK7821662.1 SEC-C domain-containing protein [Tessaracoccus sp.]